MPVFVFRAFSMRTCLWAHTFNVLMSIALTVIRLYVHM
jgi:hypothetical protein